MAWKKRAIKEFFKQYYPLALFSVVVCFIFFLSITYWQGYFEWKDIKPLPDPDLSLRMLSALVFVSFGQLLYWLKFYYVLYFIFVTILKDKRLYKDLKRLIWNVLMFIMGFYVAPWIVDLLNKILSFFYNIFAFLIYLFPPIGVSLILGLFISYYKKLQKKA